jgi:thiamine pyrophosphokinase
MCVFGFRNSQQRETGRDNVEEKGIDRHVEGPTYTLAHRYSLFIVHIVLEKNATMIAYYAHWNYSLSSILLFASNVISFSYSFSCPPQQSPPLEMTHIRRYYSPFCIQPSSSSALIILNTPIRCPQTSENRNLPDVFRVLWEATTFRVCADGGANRLYDATIEKDTDDVLVPDLITGDLDSLRPDVRSYYEKRGVPIVCVQDQDYHDLDKSLMAVEKWIIEKMHTTVNGDDGNIGCEDVIRTSNTFIYGGFGGRFDQEMACINTLYSWGKKETFRQTQMSIYDEETGVILLSEEPITNEVCIRYPDVDSEDDMNSFQHHTSSVSEQVIVGEGPTCGLIPIGGRCEAVRTTGLKWNLNGDMPLEFGGLVSSSNRIVARVVTVKTSSPLLFSFEIVKR